MSDRWIALHCSEDASSLLETHPSAFLLLTQIATRAKWKDCPITRLNKGQAYVGDWKKAGIHSEMAYRHAKKTLESCKFATFKGTNKGTVATLLNSSIYSITNDDRNDPRNSPTTDQGTGQQQAGNGQGTTNHTDTRTHGHTEHTDTKKKRSAAPLPDLPFISFEFVAAWDQWTQHRREIKKPMTALSTQKVFNKFIAWGESRAIEAIGFSIEKGWQSVYEETKQSSAPSPSAQFTRDQTSRPKFAGMHEDLEIPDA